MTRSAYFPAANRTAQNYVGKYPGEVQRTINVLVLHTTEGGGWPGYSGGSMAPTFTLNCTSGRPEWRQHFPLPHSARALRQPSGGPSTNRLNVAQVELVGTGGWATSANRNRPYTVSGAHTDWAHPDQMMLKAVADLIAWLHAEWDLPLRAPYAFGDWTGNHNHRMSSAEWSRFTGVCGHQHVWGNDHTDPGAFPIDRCLAMAAGHPLAAGTPAAKNEELSMSDVNAILAQVKAGSAQAHYDAATTQRGLTNVRRDIAAMSKVKNPRTGAVWPLHKAIWSIWYYTLDNRDRIAALEARMNGGK